MRYSLCLEHPLPCPHQVSLLRQEALLALFSLLSLSPLGPAHGWLHCAVLYTRLITPGANPQRPACCAKGPASLVYASHGPRARLPRVTSSGLSLKRGGPVPGPHPLPCLSLVFPSSLGPKLSGGPTAGCIRCSYENSYRPRTSSVPSSPDRVRRMICIQNLPSGVTQNQDLL